MTQFARTSFGYIATAAAVLWIGLGISDAQQAPVLRIKSPFAATISTIDVDHDENVAVFGMVNKSVMAWQLEDPSNPVFAWLPLRNEEPAKIHAVAVSPDGELVAASTHSLSTGEANDVKQNSARILILRRQTGEILRTIDNLPTRVQAMRFSRDGRFFAAVLAHGCHLRVWSSQNWSLLTKFDDFPDVSPDTCCPAADLSECGSSTSLEFVESQFPHLLLVTTHQLVVRTFMHVPGQNQFRLLYEVSPEQVGLQMPGRIAVSPDGRHVAIGDFRDRTITGDIVMRVAILDSVTLSLARGRRQLQITAPGSLRSALADDWDLPSVAWVKAGDGEYIFAAGNLPCRAVHDYPMAGVSKTQSRDRDFLEEQNCIARWKLDANSDPLSFIPVASHRIEEIRGLRKRGGFVFGSLNRVAALNHEGFPMQAVSGQPHSISSNNLDMRTWVRSAAGPLGFNISADGRNVEIEDFYSTQKNPKWVTFDLANLRAAGSRSPDRLLAADQDPNIVEFEGRSGWDPPKVLGITLDDPEFRRMENYHAAAVLQDRKIVLLGSDGALRLLDYADGKPRTVCTERLTESALRVNLTSDASLAVSGHADGTVRWYRILRSGNNCRFELLLSVYLTRISEHKWAWVSWTPSGQFAQDVEARPLLEWQVPQTSDRFCVVPFSQIHHFYNPSAIKRALDLDSALSAKPLRLDELCPRPFALTVLDLPANKEATEEWMPLRVFVKTDGAWPKQLTAKTGDFSSVGIRFSGKSFAPAEPVLLERTRLKEGVAEIEVQLPASVRMVKGADFSLCFYINGARDRCRSIKWLGEPFQHSKRRLWAVLVGVSNHADARMNLPFAANDAIDVASLFVADFDARVLRRSSVTPADFREINVHLAVSPNHARSRSELDRLKIHDFVRVSGATRNEILRAVEDIVVRARTRNTQEPADDVLMFFMAAHGSVHPNPNRSGRTIFASAETAFNPSPDNLDRTGIGSAELLDRLSQFPGQIIAVIDACWSLAPLDGAEPFDPAIVRLEFERKAISAHIFFGADRGQQSREVSGLAFDKTRPAEINGNGMFAYAFLDALTDPRSAGTSRDGKTLHISVRDVHRHLLDNLFGKSPDSWANRMAKERGWSYAQTPIYIPSRAQFSNDVIRTLETRN